MSIKERVMYFVDKGSHRKTVQSDVCDESPAVGPKEVNEAIDELIAEKKLIESKNVDSGWIVAIEHSPNEARKISCVNRGLHTINQGDTVTYELDGERVTATIDMILETDSYQDEVLITQFTDTDNNDHDINDATIISVKNNGVEAILDAKEEVSKLLIQWVAKKQKHDKKAKDNKASALIAKVMKECIDELVDVLAKCKNDEV